VNITILITNSTAICQYSLTTCAHLWDLTHCIWAVPSNSRYLAR